MSKKHEPLAIINPETGKKLTLSRDQASALDAIQRANAKLAGQEMNSIGESLSQLQYKGSSKDLDIHIKFDKEGKIDRDVSNTELTNSFEYLDEKTRRIVIDTIYQFTICLNQTLELRGQDLVKRLTRDINKAA